MKVLGCLRVNLEHLKDLHFEVSLRNSGLCFFLLSLSLFLRSFWNWLNRSNQSSLKAELASWPDLDF